LQTFGTLKENKS